MREQIEKQAIHTKDAPAAIGTYSPAIRVGNTVYLSGQIPLDPRTMQLVTGDTRAEITRVFDNLAAVAAAAGGSLADAVRVTIYLTDLQELRARQRGHGAILQRAVSRARRDRRRGAAARRERRSRRRARPLSSAG